MATQSGILSEEQLKDRETALLQWFMESGLDPGAIHHLPEDMSARVRLLMTLVKWVTAWKSCQSRQKMKAMGLEYPPVEPDIEPEADWVRFERWVGGLPLNWSLKEAVSGYEEPMQVGDELAEQRAAAILRMLEDRNVSVYLQDDLPAKVKYACLLRIAKSEQFEYLGAGAFHNVGCTSYCPECMQRPWCELGQEEWLEDEEAGRLIVPEEARVLAGGVFPEIPVRDGFIF